MKCIMCTNIDLSCHLLHAANGMGVCKLDNTIGVFYTIFFDRDCDKFIQADEKTIQSRRQWWKIFGSKRKNNNKNEKHRA